MSEVRLPEGWCRTRLGDVIAGFEAGRNLKAQGRPAEGDELGVLKISAVTWGAFRPHENKALLPGDQPKPHELIKAGDLLITRANTTELVGAVVLVERDFPTLMLPDKVLRLLVLDDAADSRFLVYALRTEEVRRHFEANATGTSHSMRNLSQPKMRAAPLRLAPVNEQRRIVAKIEALQERSRAAREALEAVPPLLDRFRQSVLAAAFRGDLTADWRARNPDVEPASVLLERIRKERRLRWEKDQLAKMKAKGKEPKNDKWKTKYKEPEPVDTEGLPELPDGWCWTTVEEVGSAAAPLCYGVVQPGPEVVNGVPLVRVCDVKDGRVDESALRSISHEVDEQYSRSRLCGGEVLISIVGSIGRTAVCPTSLRGANIARAVARIAPTNEVDPKWVSMALSTPRLQDWLIRGAREVARKTLNLGVLERAAIPLAPLDEMNEILTLLSDGNRPIQAVGQTATDLAHLVGSLDQSILAKAFRGELVPQDPNDEPASVLLERIQAEREAAAPKKKSRGRRTKKKAKKPAATEDAEPAPPAALPKPTPKSKPRRTTPEFLDLEPDDQIEMVFEALVAAGLLEVNDAIRHVADHLRETGASDHKRLRTGGRLWTSIENTLKLGARRGYFDRRRRGHVRVVMTDPKEYDRDHWRAALLASLDGEPTDRDDAMRDAADWAAENMGLEFKRLRSDGIIMKGFKSAMNSAIRRGEVERVGGGQVKRTEDG